MKKYVVGFLLTSFLLLVVSGAALWFLLIKPAVQVAGSAVDGARTGLGQIAAIAQTSEAMRRLDERITTKGSYLAPNDGRIYANQVARFVAVQNAVINVLGPEFTRLEAAARQPGGALRIADGIGAIAQLGNSGIAAKTAQVEALNAHAMSLDEYRWIRSSAIAALVAGGVSVRSLDVETAASGLTDAARRAAQEAIAAAASAGERIERVRQAAAATSSIWSGERQAPPNSERERVESAPASALDSTSYANPATDETVLKTNFAMIESHTDVFLRAPMLAALSL